MNRRSSSPVYASNELWHDASRHPTSLGCSNCPEFSKCGGIRVGASVYDCNDMCRCAEVANCDVVCRCRPDHFVARVRDVRGFAFSNVPRASPIPAARMPLAIPLIDHRSSRNSYFSASIVALPLYRVVNMATGRLHVESRSELSERFKVAADARIVLSGVDKDRYVEGWWNFPNRSELLAGLRNIGVELITSPNFSLLSDVPRTDNLHAMKRIALVWSEIVRAGISGALHINARTDADYDRWVDFIRDRSEVAVISFEFATGCGRSDRIDWHINKLCELASKVARPLHLIVRGGSHRLALLRASFEAVTMLETDSFAKTHRRQRATLMPDGRVRWKRQTTSKGDPLDDLFLHNCSVVRAAIEMGRRHVQSTSRPAIAIPIRRRAPNRDGKSIQPSLLGHVPTTSEARAISFDRDRAVSATKP